MHPKNSFITLTYSDKNLGDPKLDYRDFQLFMKKLRKLQDEPIGVFVTGEYGEKTKRKHWHAILFNYDLPDKQFLRTNERGDRIYKSCLLDRTWGKNDPEKKPNEVGSVTFHSAGYCARYAAKKLVHGKDDQHEFHPVSKKSSKHAIGKRWLERFWPDVFTHGQIVLPDGSTCGIPRYYEKWLKENVPHEWARYVTRTKQEKINFAALRAALENLRYWDNVFERPYWKPNPLTRNQVRAAIQQAKFKQLQDHLKL